MKRIRTAILAGALLLAVPISFAEEAHHPDEAAPAPAPLPAQQQAMPGGMMPGMMSPDMMQMMMGVMSAGNGPMMGQMGQTGPMMSPDHVEGRIAFLKAELKVTDDQQPLWEPLAETIRAGADSMKDMMPSMQGGMMGAGAAGVTALERIEIHEKALSARLQALRQIKAALKPFYATLDEGQKQKADRLLAPAPMGMM
ncbi:Spy/CpxP family protein refolding chaperone [Chelativorans alearense]|uniref:Spy/CpxP family protein refolding chaperone n=1 Tax=Chelativorans alearense TaxID=2681495 RepID=UPI0013D702D8|nr:Spy/CpxP family protein refolding chaperone [Chelativorans alearense]